MKKGVIKERAFRKGFLFSVGLLFLFSCLNFVSAGRCCGPGIQTFDNCLDVYQYGCEKYLDFYDMTYYDYAVRCSAPPWYCPWCSPSIDRLERCEGSSVCVMGGDGYPTCVGLTSAEASGIPVDSDGDGYLEIDTCAKLQNISLNPSSDYELMNDISCTGFYFMTIQDFTGELNGNSRTITGLNSPLFSSVSRSQIYDLKFSGLAISGRGIFGTVVNSELKNIEIRDSSLSCISYNNCGMLAGEVINSNFSDISMTRSTVKEGDSYEGGLVGNVLLDQSYFGSSLFSNLRVDNSEVSGGMATGGLIGRFGAVPGSNLTLSSSSFQGTVSPAGNTAGGLVGENYGKILSCNGDATVRLVSEYSYLFGDFYGGLVGTNYGNIKDSTSTTSSYPTVSGHDYLGTVVGKNIGGILDNVRADYDNRHITSSSPTHSGGLLGFNDGGFVIGNDFDKAPNITVSGINSSLFYKVNYSRNTLNIPVTINVTGNEDSYAMYANKNHVVSLEYELNGQTLRDERGNPITGKTNWVWPYILNDTFNITLNYEGDYVLDIFAESPYGNMSLKSINFTVQRMPKHDTFPIENGTTNFANLSLNLSAVKNLNLVYARAGKPFLKMNFSDSPDPINVEGLNLDAIFYISHISIDDSGVWNNVHDGLDYNFISLLDINTYDPYSSGDFTYSNIFKAKNVKFTVMNIAKCPIRIYEWEGHNIIRCKEATTVKCENVACYDPSSADFGTSSSGYDFSSYPTKYFSFKLSELMDENTRSFNFVYLEKVSPDSCWPGLAMNLDSLTYLLFRGGYVDYYPSAPNFSRKNYNPFIVGPTTLSSKLHCDQRAALYPGLDCEVDSDGWVNDLCDCVTCPNATYSRSTFFNYSQSSIYSVSKSFGGYVYPSRNLTGVCCFENGTDERRFVKFANCSNSSQIYDKIYGVCDYDIIPDSYYAISGFGEHTYNVDPFTCEGSSSRANILGNDAGAEYRVPYCVNPGADDKFYFKNDKCSCDKICLNPWYGNESGVFAMESGPHCYYCAKTEADFFSHQLAGRNKVDINITSYTSESADVTCHLDIMGYKPSSNINIKAQLIKINASDFKYSVDSEQTKDISIGCGQGDSSDFVFSEGLKKNDAQITACKFLIEVRDPTDSSYLFKVNASTDILADIDKDGFISRKQIKNASEFISFWNIYQGLFSLDPYVYARDAVVSNLEPFSYGHWTPGDVVYNGFWISQRYTAGGDCDDWPFDDNATDNAGNCTKDLEKLKALRIPEMTQELKEKLCYSDSDNDGLADNSSCSYCRNPSMREIADDVDNDCQGNCQANSSKRCILFDEDYVGDGAEDLNETYLGEGFCGYNESSSSVKPINNSYNIPDAFCQMVDNNIKYCEEYEPDKTCSKEANCSGYNRAVRFGYTAKYKESLKTTYDPSTNAPIASSMSQQVCPNGKPCFSQVYDLVIVKPSGLSYVIPLDIIPAVDNPAKLKETAVINIGDALCGHYRVYTNWKQEGGMYMPTGVINEIVPIGECLSSNEASGKKRGTIGNISADWFIDSFRGELNYISQYEYLPFPSLLGGFGSSFQDYITSNGFTNITFWPTQCVAKDKCNDGGSHDLKEDLRKVDPYGYYLPAPEAVEYQGEVYIPNLPNFSLVDVDDPDCKFKVKNIDYITGSESEEYFPNYSSSEYLVNPIKNSSYCLDKDGDGFCGGLLSEVDDLLSDCERAPSSSPVIPTPEAPEPTTPCIAYEKKIVLNESETLKKYSISPQFPDCDDNLTDDKTQYVGSTGKPIVTGPYLGWGENRTDTPLANSNYSAWHVHPFSPVTPASCTFSNFDFDCNKDAIDNLAELFRGTGPFDVDSSTGKEFICYEGGCDRVCNLGDDPYWVAARDVSNKIAVASLFSLGAGAGYSLLIGATKLIPVPVSLFVGTASIMDAGINGVLLTDCIAKFDKNGIQNRANAASTLSKCIVPGFFGVTLSGGLTALPAVRISLRNTARVLKINAAGKGNLLGKMSSDGTLRFASQPLAKGIKKDADSPNAGGCFLNSTKILMADGSLKSIEDIFVGEKVVAYDLENEKPVNASVTQTFIRNENKFRRITYEQIA